MKTTAFLAFHVDTSALDWLMREFRLLVNESIRTAVTLKLGSRYRLARASYADLSRRHSVYKQYIPSAFGVALRAVKGYRRRLRKGLRASIPFAHRPMVEAENQSYRLDRRSGMLRIPIRAGQHVVLSLPVSRWHEKYLTDPAWSLGALTVVPGRVIIAVRREAPNRYDPESAIALDMNEESLDGVFSDKNHAKLIRVPLKDIRTIQERHHRRRRSFSARKSHDHRVLSKLLAKEGVRERNRVDSRLHFASKRLVEFAAAKRAAIVLEKLTFHGAGGPSHNWKRRFTSWPRGRLRRLIEYKANAIGVPIIFIDPHYTSKTCPACGAQRRGRVGRMFECECGWRMDRQTNAGLNILKRALASNEALARAVRFQPDPLRHDVVISLYDLRVFREVARGESSEADLTKSLTEARQGN